LRKKVKPSSCPINCTRVTFWPGSHGIANRLIWPGVGVIDGVGVVVGVPVGVLVGVTVGVPVGVRVGVLVGVGVSS